jgi:DNA mismatch repair protein MSH6
MVTKKLKVINDDDDSNELLNNLKYTTPRFKQEAANSIKNTKTTNKRSSSNTMRDGDDNSDCSSTAKAVKPKKKKSDTSVLSNSPGGDILITETFSNPENGLPDFLKPENIRDSNLRYPNDPDFDPTTLFIPDQFIKKATPSMQQYWGFKRDNFDKVLLFKLGKFYEMFYDDAIVGNQVLELRWMGNDPNKLHVGFPEKVLEEKAAILVESGFKVAVIEQTEREKDRAERLSAEGGKKKSANEKVIKRELCNVLTKGTYMAPNNNSYNNKYCVALVLKDNTWGFTVFDLTTLCFYFGELIETDDTYNQIMTFLYNIRPDEVVIMKGNLPNYVLNFIATISSKPQITILKHDFNVILLQKICRKYFGDDMTKWNEIIANLLMNEEKFKANCNSLYITISYLEKILLAEQCLPVANFQEYYVNAIINNRLIMDYQAISNLELLETKLDPRTPERGSLLEYMNKSVTPFGKRMFKTWLLNPLTDIKYIEARLSIVDELIANDNILINFRGALNKWPDIERQCSKIYKFAIQTASKAIYFEDISKNRLQEFFNIINFLKKSIDIFKIFDKIEIKSEKLHNMVKFVSQGGIVPDIKHLLDDFTNNFTIKYDDNSNIIVEPCTGVYDIYDNLKIEIDNIGEELDEILQRERKRLNCNNINFVHTKAHRYELEVPENIVTGNKKPSDYKLTTSRKGFLRYHTNHILELLKQLEDAEDKLKQEITKFNFILFKQFYEKNRVFDDYIKNIAELDCLCALATIAINVYKFFNLSQMA